MRLDPSESGGKWEEMESERWQGRHPGPQGPLLLFLQLLEDPWIWLSCQLSAVGLRLPVKDITGLKVEEFGEGGEVRANCCPGMGVQPVEGSPAAGRQAGISSAHPVFKGF